MGLFLEITANCSAIFNLSVESLAATITHSPIVSEDYVLKGFAAISILL